MNMSCQAIRDVVCTGGPEIQEDGQNPPEAKEVICSDGTRVIWGYGNQKKGSNE